ncbi:MAG: hypothetical protein APR54_04750 [Candidatus Cloacimonas sp. SDB]|nr:MAG: hypothetical protein APR54_04750 [Candidatus Cloacimonas sp. SDB]
MIKRMMIIATVLVFFWGCSQQPQQKLIGSWVVDYTETFKTIKNSEVWNELDEMEREMFPDILEEMTGSMTITIKENEMITQIGNELINVDYRIESESGNEIVTIAYIEGDEATLTFRILENNLMMFTSDKTNDMDFLVWKRDLMHKI